VALIEVKLPFDREVTRYVVANDDGRERWFDKSKLDVRVEGGTVVAMIDAKQWRGRVKNSSHPKAPTKLKKCLCCRQSAALEKNQYICNSCKQTPDWKDGAAVAGVMF
jgi:hypothetical protein